MKKILWMLMGVLLMSSIYYFFIRSFEFKVSFKASTLPGDLIETIRLWNKSIDGARVMEVDSFGELRQTIVWKNKTYAYNWYFTETNDSVTKVDIQIAEPGRSLLNKLLIPFTDQHIERDANDIVRGFYDVLKTHLAITRVKIKGESELDSSFCVCRSIETSQIGKANGMMRDYSILTSFISDFGLKTAGRPSVRVSAWDHSRGLLKFDFCFPIVPADSLPLARSVIYKQFRKEKVLKAEYFGNYITSDRAWYELIQYAGKKGYKIQALPIEIFHDNPNLGMNERKWRAEVYLPIIE